MNISRKFHRRYIPSDAPRCVCGHVTQRHGLHDRWCPQCKRVTRGEAIINPTSVAWRQK